MAVALSPDVNTRDAEGYMEIRLQRRALLRDWEFLCGYAERVSTARLHLAVLHGFRLMADY